MAGMVIVLELDAPEVEHPAPYPVGVMMATKRDLSAAVLTRLASAGALTFSVAISLVVLLAYATYPPFSRHFLLAFVATAIYLPLHLRHVVYALRGTRPPALAWTLLATAAVIIGFTPVLGTQWLYSFYALAASVLVTTRLRVSAPTLVAILVAVGIWSTELGVGLGAQVAEAIYLPAAVLQRSMVIFVLVWLVGALRKVQAARFALAEETLAAERARVDEELSRSVGAELEAVLQEGQLALQTMAVDSLVAEETLGSLVDRSRRALADARRLARRYQELSSFAELEQAAALLRAAGMDVEIDATTVALPPRLDESLRYSLRTVVSQLLREEARGTVVLRLGQENDSYRIEAVRASRTEPSA